MKNKLEEKEILKIGGIKISSTKPLKKRMIRKLKEILKQNKEETKTGHWC